MIVSGLKVSEIFLKMKLAPPFKIRVLLLSVSLPIARRTPPISLAGFRIRIVAMESCLKSTSRCRHFKSTTFRHDCAPPLAHSVRKFSVSQSLMLLARSGLLEMLQDRRVSSRTQFFRMVSSSSCVKVQPRRVDVMPFLVVSGTVLR